MRILYKLRVTLIFLGISLWSISPQLVFSDSKLRQYNIPDAPKEYLAMSNPFTSAADLERGESLYQSKCSECHGEQGEGDGEAAVLFNDLEYLQSRSDGQLFFIAKEGAGDDGEMEAYGDESDYGMSDKKLWQMITYIRTLAK